MPTKQLWAPWRMEFIKEPKEEKGSCVFCELLKAKQDRESLIVHRSKKAFVILNKFPYNNGHVMVVPFRHTADLTCLPTAELTEMSELIQLCVKGLQATYRPEGFNIGMNLGASGGAGIREHLHMHVVPRWTGDTNFMPVIADTKSMPQHLMESYDILHNYFSESGKR